MGHRDAAVSLNASIQIIYQESQSVQEACQPLNFNIYRVVPWQSHFLPKIRQHKIGRYQNINYLL